jgi:hypothetical protein
MGGLHYFERRLVKFRLQDSIALYETVSVIQFVFIGSHICLNILFVKNICFIDYLRELFNYILIGVKNAVDICKTQNLQNGEGITKRTRQVSV